jgi:hypothetical protein
MVIGSYPPQPLPHWQPDPQPQFPPQHDIFLSKINTDRSNCGHWSHNTRALTLKIWISPSAPEPHAGRVAERVATYREGGRPSAVHVARIGRPAVNKSSIWGGGGESPPVGVSEFTVLPLIDWAILRDSTVRPSLADNRTHMHGVITYDPRVWRLVCGL